MVSSHALITPECAASVVEGSSSLRRPNAADPSRPTIAVAGLEFDVHDLFGVGHATRLPVDYRDRNIAAPGPRSDHDGPVTLRFLIIRPILYLSWICGLFVSLGGIALLFDGQWLPGLLAPLGLVMVGGGFYFGVIRPEGEIRMWWRFTAINSATGLGILFTFFGAVFGWAHNWWGLTAVAIGFPLFAVGMYCGFVRPWQSRLAETDHLGKR